MSQHACCPYCSAALRSPKAMQCFKCGMDWHDPANPVKRSGLTEAEKERLDKLPPAQAQAADAIQQLGGEVRITIHGNAWIKILGPAFQDNDLQRLRHFKVTNLRIDAPNITDAGMKHVSSLRWLEILEISNCPVTDQGLRELINSSVLRKIILTGTHVSQEAAREAERMKAASLYLNGELMIGRTKEELLADVNALQKLGGLPSLEELVQKRRPSIWQRIRSFFGRIIGFFGWYSTRALAASRMAMGFFRLRLGLAPKWTGEFLHRGMALAEKGEYGQAIADFTEAIERLELRIEGLLEYDRGIDDFIRANQLDDALACAYHNRGAAYVQEDDWDRAIADFEEAIRLEPEYAEAYFSLGLAHAQGGRYDQAVADWNEVLRLDPDMIQAYVERAIVDCSESIRLAPETPSAMFLLRGTLHFVGGRHAEAAADYTEAMHRNPQDPEAYLGRAKAYRALGEKEKAGSDERKARELGGPAGNTKQT